MHDLTGVADLLAGAQRSAEQEFARILKAARDDW
jgi:hypothetical protein